MMDYKNRLIFPQRKYMNKILFLLTTLLFLACSKKEKSTFTLEGQIENPVNNYIVLYEESDIERKSSTLVDTIFLDEKGKFKAKYKSAPHYYRLDIGNNENIPLVLDKGQQVTINIKPDDVSITGSKDTDLLLAYEKLRGNSLDRLVKSVRKQITEVGKSENPNAKIIDSLGKLELKNYQLMRPIYKRIQIRMGFRQSVLSVMQWHSAINITTPLFTTSTVQVILLSV